MDDQTALALNITTAVLLLISELLGISKCDSNGILDFLFKTISCLKKTKEGEQPEVALKSMKEPSHQGRIVTVE